MMDPRDFYPPSPVKLGLTTPRRSRRDDSVEAVLAREPAIALPVSTWVEYKPGAPRRRQQLRAGQIVGHVPPVRGSRWRVEKGVGGLAMRWNGLKLPPSRGYLIHGEVPSLAKYGCAVVRHYGPLEPKVRWGQYILDAGAELQAWLTAFHFATAWNVRELLGYYVSISGKARPGVAEDGRVWIRRNWRDPGFLGLLSRWETEKGDYARELVVRLEDGLFPAPTKARAP